MRFVQRAEDGIPRVQARDVIKRLIRTKGYGKGDRLPTYSEFSKQLGFAILTIQRAMDDLAEEGVVYRLHGKGTFVGRASADVPVNLTRAALVFPSSPSFLIETYHLNQILAGILDMCGRHHIDLNILSLHASGGKVSPGKIAEQAEGALLLDIDDENYLAGFDQEGVPAVGVDLYAPGVPLSYVAVDNGLAVRQVMEHLAALEHRRIGYVEPHETVVAGSSEESHDAVERREAYFEFMRGAGLSSFAKVYGLKGQDGREAVDSIADDLLKPDAPTAIVAYDDYVAMKVMPQLVSRGIRIPERVSLAAAAGSNPVSGAVSSLLLTSCAVNFREMGRLAVEKLRERCGGARPKAAGVTRFAPRLVAGTTTARAVSSAG